ncbi:MAG TPA: hypothetical protein VLL52_06465 [Anaerolineae bacterium]|nr:hypothetical protein [Anaerolineae bacterium]
MITTQTFDKLMAHEGNPCLTLYMPLALPAIHHDNNRIRFKNLVQDAKELLGAYEAFDETSIDNYLQPLYQMEKELEQGGYPWQPGTGMVAFLDQQVWETYPLPMKVKAQVQIGESFYLKPLLPLLHDSERFYVLAISQQDVRLFEGNRYEISALPIHEQMPRQISDVLYLDDPEKQLQGHMAQKVGVGASGVMYHGHGVTNKEVAKEELRRYCRQIDVGLQLQLKEQSVPLILAGVDYLVSIYREISDYKSLMPSGIYGNPDLLREEQLLEKAREVMLPYWEQAKKTAVKQYYAAQAHNKATADIEQIVTAAHHGQIETLFVARHEAVWGEYDPLSNDVTLSTEEQMRYVDLLDEAAIATHDNGGTVYLVPADQIPDDELAVAIFRYPMMS